MREDGPAQAPGTEHPLALPVQGSCLWPWWARLDALPETSLRTAKLAVLEQIGGRLSPSGFDVGNGHLELAEELVTDDVLAAARPWRRGHIYNAFALSHLALRACTDAGR